MNDEKTMIGKKFDDTFGCHKDRTEAVGLHSNYSYQSFLDFTLNLIDQVKKEVFIPMPAEFEFHNANVDRCDMLVGPCACGAWHSAKDFISKMIELFKSKQEIVKG